MTILSFFSGGLIDRRADIRADPAALAAALADASARFVPVWKGNCLIDGNTAALLSRTHLPVTANLADAIYLGQRAGQNVFTLAIPDQAEPVHPEHSAFGNFRSLMSDLPADDAALLAYAKGMIEWQRRHRHCGACGSPNHSEQGGFVLACTSTGCDHRSFPRIDPAIIVLVIDGERCLLGRQRGWPENRYSTIAGFVEPGESLEDAVGREVAEEANIRIARARYLGSQPWPFPNAMMIGFHAEAASLDIRLNDGELADARWLSREEMAAGEVALPPATSIAFRLIEAWFDGWDGPALSSLNLTASFTRSAAESG